MGDSVDANAHAADLREARMAARMSQRHLALAAGLSDRTVRRVDPWEPV